MGHDVHFLTSQQHWFRVLLSSWVSLFPSVYPYVQETQVPSNVYSPSECFCMQPKPFFILIAFQPTDAKSPRPTLLIAEI